MRLTEMFAQAAEGVRNHTGLHYVPSFNDLCTNSADDLEDQELARSTSGPASATMSDTTPAESPAASPTTTSRPRTNKQDDWPQFESIDIDKVNVSKSHRNRHHHYDIPREGKGPSIWEYILTSSEKQAASGSGKEGANRGTPGGLGSSGSQEQPKEREIISTYGSE